MNSKCRALLDRIIKNGLIYERDLSEADRQRVKYLLQLDEIRLSRGVSPQDVIYEKKY